MGLPTNLKFLKNVLDDPVFFKGDYDTGFIGKYSDSLIKRVKEVAAFDVASAIAARLAIDFSKIQLPKELVSFRNGRHLSNNLKITSNASFFEAPISSNVQVQIQSADKAVFMLAGKKHEVSFKLASPNTLMITFSGRSVAREFYIEGETVYLFD